MSMTHSSIVYLIGAGPDNPGLLTKKAERSVRSADMVLFSYLVNPLILRYASSQTKVISVGEKPCCKHIQQEEID